MLSNLTLRLGQLDGLLLIWIQENLRSSLLDPFMIFYTNLGDHGMMWLFLCFCLYLYPKTRKAGYMGLFSLALGALFTNVMIKPLLQRTRPYLVLELSRALVTSSDANSFPSGHTCAAFASAFGWRRNLPEKWMRILGLALAFLMGCSRLYTGVHYPSDVIAGAVIGWISGMIMNWGVERFHQKENSLAK